MRRENRGEQSNPEVPGAQKHDLVRRIAELDANPENVLTWEQIREAVLKGR